MREIKNVKTLDQFMTKAMPRHLSKGLPSSRLLSCWREIAGDAVAERAFPVRQEPQGALVVAVRGSVWRQELSMASPVLLRKLTEYGFDFNQIKFVKARTQFTPPPEPPLPELTEKEEEELKKRVENVSDPDLAETILRVMRAEERVKKADHR